MRHDMNNENMNSVEYLLSLSWYDLLIKMIYFLFIFTIAAFLVSVLLGLMIVLIGLTMGLIGLGTMGLL